MKKVLFALILISYNSLWAQEKENNNAYGPLITDRPDQTESPDLIPKGLLQIELGFLYEEKSEENFNEETFIYNTTLIRYGLLENLELRLGFDIAQSKIKKYEVPKTESMGGFSPLYVGFKIGIVEEKKLLPKIGFLGGAILPFSAAEVFKPEGTGGEFRFSFAHTLSKTWGFSYNFGASWNGEPPYISYIYTAVLNHGFTTNLSGFVEIYGEFPEQRRSEHLIDAGFTYLLSNSLQLDLSAGTGLTTSQDYFVGAGISVRLPH